MRFESFISALDMGRCEDQIQREALFDLALLFVMIDGVVTDSENKFMRDWLDSLPWNSEVSKDEHYQNALRKCDHALENDGIEDFIAHRAKQLVDEDVKQQAIQLAKDISNADGDLDDREQAAIDQLNALLAD